MEIVLVVISLLGFANSQTSPCYDAGGVPVPCGPPSLDNIVAGSLPVVTSTCGVVEAERVCEVSGLQCEVCNSSDPSSSQSHLPLLITDGSTDTYWQSQTYRRIGQGGVNITFNFLKAFIIHEIQIRFHGPRPDSFSLHTSFNDQSVYRPLQYFSKSCQETYSIPESTSLCSSDGVGLTPLSGGISRWVPTSSRITIATSLQIRLERLSTLGNEITQNDKVLDSYSYSISDITIRGQCYCNGHGSSCVTDTNGQISCICSHNTASRDCQYCLPSHNDIEWSAATDDAPNECQKCNCNGRSNMCHFDIDVFRRSGNVSGGACDNCTDNTAGINCLECAEGYFPDPSSVDLKCIPCICDPRGVEGSNGTCSSANELYAINNSCVCKENVGGVTCNRCDSGFFNLTNRGCQRCSCYIEGSTSSDCDPITGQCTCKSKHFFGRTCRSCDCHETGTLNVAAGCDSNGTCTCRDGVGGAKCDHCLRGYYNIAEGCNECSCNINGSTGADCDPTTGQCDCREGFSGRDCSMCPDGSHNIEEGCTECPECYNEIRETYNETLNRLRMLMIAVNKSLETSKNDEQLVRALFEVSSKLLRLYDLLMNVTEREEYLWRRINEVQKILRERMRNQSQFTQVIEDAHRTSRQLQQTNTTIQRNINIFFSQISTINGHLTTAATNLSTALELATRISNIVNNLASIARALEISALNQSLTVHELLQQMYLLNDNTTDLLFEMCEILDIENSTLNLLLVLADCSSNELDVLLEEAQTKLQAAVGNASEILIESKSLYNKVSSIVLPDFNSHGLLNNSLQLVTDAGNVYQEGEEVLDDIEGLRDNFTLLYSEAKLLFQKIEYLNQTAVELIVREHGARAMGNITAAEGENLIEEIDKLLMMLEQRLLEQMVFLSKLENLTALVERAENTSNKSLSAANEQRSILEGILDVAHRSEELLNATELTLLQTEMIILSTVSKVNLTDRNIQALTSNISSLEGVLNDTEGSVLRLEERGRKDNEVIDLTLNVINTTIITTGQVEETAERIIELLERLEKDVNSTTLLSEEDYSTVLQQLDSAEMKFEVLEESLRNATSEIEHLESQHKVLEERYNKLQLHRDLLVDMKNNLENLDCQSEFV